MTELVKAYMEQIAEGRLPDWNSPEAVEYRRYRQAEQQSWIWAQGQMSRIRMQAKMYARLQTPQYRKNAIWAEIAQS